MVSWKWSVGLGVIVSMAVAGSASAVMVAGWDFSQYQGQQYMDTDSSFTYKDSLESNYSDLDPSLGAGRNGAISGTPCPIGASCSFGELHFDGDLGSTAIPEKGFLDSDFRPLSGSLFSNFDAPGMLDFDSHVALQSEGQLFADAYRMNYAGSTAASIVFEVDLTSQTDDFTNWELVFAARTDSGLADIEIAFATSLEDAVPEWSTDQVVAINATDSSYTVDLDGLGRQSDTAYVRMTFSGTGGAPNIDNVAVFADAASPPAPPVPAASPLGLSVLTALLLGGGTFAGRLNARGSGAGRRREGIPGP
jgi:hypothetical protein